MTAPKSAIKARDGRGRAIRSLETVAQDQEAAELRSQSMTYPQIAKKLGVSVSTAYERVTRGLQAVPSENVVEVRRLELAKLDHIEAHLLGVMEREPGVQAAMGLLRVQERRARLLGLDAPAQIRVETITEDMLDREIRQFSEQHRLDHSEPVDDCSICRLIASVPVEG